MTDTVRTQASITRASSHGRDCDTGTTCAESRATDETPAPASKRALWFAHVSECEVCWILFRPPSRLWIWRRTVPQLRVSPSVFPALALRVEVVHRYAP
jgi:hypothetical protein